MTKYVTSREELADLRKTIDRDLGDAAIVEVSNDRRFAIAFNAALLLAHMAIACAGYRITGGGRNYTTFLVLPIALPETKRFASYFERCRERRNAISYETAGTISGGEVVEILARVSDLRDEIEAWIAANHPELAHHAG